MAQRGSSRWTRKRAGDQTGGKDKPKSDLVMPKLPPNGYPSEHPFNKDSFRYILAEPDPHAPYKQEYDDSNDLAGKPIPGWFFRKLVPSVVNIAMNDRAPQLKVSEDRLSFTGERGYCMGRATHGVNYGTYYYEITIADQPEGSHCRLGWSQELGNLQGPCGYDKFSYGWRSRKGTVFHESHGKHFSCEGFGVGDTLGFLIHLPEDPAPPELQDENDHGKSNKKSKTGAESSSTIREVVNRKDYVPPNYKDRPLVKFKSYLYFELKDEVSKVAKNLKPLIGSRIVCYKNGKEIGVAFRDIYAGTYFPCASLYKGITVTFNFGPNFKHPPDANSPVKSCPEIKEWKGVNELADEETIARVISDLMYFVDRRETLSDLLNNFGNVSHQ